MHQRQAIREAVRSQLVDKTAAQDRVFKTRMVPWRKVELPAISVYTLEESVDPDSRSTAPRELTRNLQLAVQAAVSLGDNVDDAVDDITQEIERALHADPTFGGACSDALLTSTQIGIEEDGSRPLGHVSLVFAVTYFTQAPDAMDQVLVDLTKVVVTQDVSGGTNPSGAAVDELAIPTT